MGLRLRGLCAYRTKGGTATPRFFHARGKSRKLRPSAAVALSFLGTIFIGAALLCLPVSSSDGTFTGYMDALFTATSATCVTGLITVSTAVHWSAFGKSVILMLIQIGGLGVMTFASLASFAMHRTFTLQERMVMGAGLNMTDNAGIVRLTRRVLLGTLAFESIGAILLSIRFVPVYGLARGVRYGVFHAVSAFCNAGFDLLGTPANPYPSLTGMASDPLVNLTVMALVVIGGLGFFVWSDVYDKRRFHSLHLHTKIVLVMTLGLLALGFALTLLFEWSNPETLGALPPGSRALAAGFQSVTLRTAGFNTIDQAALTGPSQAIGCALMLIGGSPGSTAGGVKTVTAAILLLSTLSALRGRTRVTAFGRLISPRSIINAITMLIVGVTLSVSGACAISFLDSAPFYQCLYEAVSAFGTVGVSMGLTPSLSAASQSILIALMYLGRVGVLTLGVAVLMRHREPPKMSYPEGHVMVG